MPSELSKTDPIAYRAARESASWSDRSGRRRLEIGGPDRAKFLHNLTTNDVKRLGEGAGHESFVTSPQGKILAYVTLLATEASTILVRTDAESIEALRAHLEKYGVFDDVTIEDVSAGTFEYHVAGPESRAILESLGIEIPSEEAYRHRSTGLSGATVRVVRESPTGSEGLTLIGSKAEAEVVKAALENAFVPAMDEATFDTLRIEAGTPISGRDATLTNLPQEVGRDALAINFVKGCYLGQETVARIDALGHVNRIFKGLRFHGTAVPPAGTPLTFEGKVVGSITSSGFSPGWGEPIALGYVRVTQAEAGTKLVATAEGLGEVEAIVQDLPMLPPAVG